MLGDVIFDLPSRPAAPNRNFFLGYGSACRDAELHLTGKTVF